MKKLLPLLITLLFNPFLIAENDPFEEINRTTMKVNKKLDEVIATPVAKFYQKITPDFIELGIYNSISNIDDVNISLNNNVINSISNIDDVNIRNRIVDTYFNKIRSDLLIKLSNGCCNGFV